MFKITIFNHYGKGRICRASVGYGFGIEYSGIGDTLSKAISSLFFRSIKILDEKAKRILVRQILHNPKKFGVTLEFRGAKGQLVKPPKHLRKK